MRIEIEFKTKKGEEAYKKSCEEGNKQNKLINQMFGLALGQDKIVQENPLIVEIRYKVPRIAIRLNSVNKLKEWLTALKLKEQIDFIIKVSYAR